MRSGRTLRPTGPGGKSEKGLKVPTMTTERVTMTHRTDLEALTRQAPAPAPAPALTLEDYWAAADADRKREATRPAPAPLAPAPSLTRWQKFTRWLG